VEQNASQSRSTPSKDAPPQPAAHDPPSSKPREWLPPPFKEQFVATNDKPLLQKKGDTATTSMVNREALKGPPPFPWLPAQLA